MQFVLHRVVWVKHEAKGHITSFTMNVLPQVVQFVLHRVVWVKHEAKGQTMGCAVSLLHRFAWRSVKLKVVPQDVQFLVHTGLCMGTLSYRSYKSFCCRRLCRSNIEQKVIPQLVQFWLHRGVQKH